MQTTDIRRIALGTFTRPTQETGGAPVGGTVLGYVVRHDAGVFLFDTGMGQNAGVDAWYQPRRVPLQQALGTLGLDLGDVDHVVNCHLHFDHCGGNPLLARRPVWCQRRELEGSGEPDYTLPELVDFPGATYELLDGDTEIAPGLWVFATPGHVPGHQSLAARCSDGTIVLAGQAYDTAAEFGSAVTDVPRDPSVGERPAWLDRVLALDPARVLFAHDEAVWQPA